MIREDHYIDQSPCISSKECSAEKHEKLDWR